MTKTAKEKKSKQTSRYKPLDLSTKDGRVVYRCEACNEEIHSRRVSYHKTKCENANFSVRVRDIMTSKEAKISRKDFLDGHMKRCSLGPTLTLQ